MASTSKQIENVTRLDLDQVKRNYFNLLEKNKKFIKEPMCTREGIEEKIKMITANPRETQDLILKNVNGKNTLLVKKNQWKSLEILPIEEAFDMLLKVHLACGHGNAIETYQQISHRYSLPMVCSNWIVESCNVCSPENLKQDQPKLVSESPTKIGRGLWRLNIIKDDCLPAHSGRVCFLLILKEETTNFVVLRPLYESSEELALDLMKIFTEFGYPERVYVPDMIKFYKKIFHLVYLINPERKVPVEEVRNNNVFEKDKFEVLKEIQTWMMMTEDRYWEQSCHLVQYKMNTTEKSFTRLFSNEQFVGIPFQQFFDYRVRTNMTWVQSPFVKY